MSAMISAACGSSANGSPRRASASRARSSAKSASGSSCCWASNGATGSRTPPAWPERWRGSLLDVGGAALVVSQFTLSADARKGNRPSFAQAAPPNEAEPLYDRFCEALAAEGARVERGVFGARMAVALVNDGPVTILLD